MAMNQDHLNKLIRISETVRKLSAEAQKEEIRQLHGYKYDYKNQHQLLEPIIQSNTEYQLEFLALRKPTEISFTEIRPAFIGLSSLIDSIIKQETLGNRQQNEQFSQEYFIEENKSFSAYRQITQITDTAVSSLKIVDNYIDSNTLDFFLGVNNKTTISILTMKCLPNPPAFIASVAKFKTQWAGDFEVKITNYFHDRFIISDDKEVWHLGPSLNYLGKKPMMISKVQDPEILKKIIELFDNQWKISTTFK